MKERDAWREAGRKGIEEGESESVGGLDRGMQVQASELELFFLRWDTKLRATRRRGTEQLSMHIYNKNGPMQC